MAGLFRILTNQLKKMIEQVVPITIALITGSGVLFNRVHNKIHDLDRRIDSVELRVAESYVSKTDFNNALVKMEGHMVRIEEKLDKLVEKKCN